MPKLLIIANENKQVRKLSSELVQKGFSCRVIVVSRSPEHSEGGAKQSDNAIKYIAEQSPSLVLMDMDSLRGGSEMWDLPQRIKEERDIPVIALIPREMLDNLDSSLSIDDFVAKPWNLSEVTARVKRILKQTNNMKEMIKCGDLVIDLAKCQVAVGGRLVMLTFREYQLLKFLVDNPGKVFTREALLDKVWGWDYYGGDRTVDVHIRRLRSKIEDRNHSFIETVRNIGYRFAEGK